MWPFGEISSVSPADAADKLQTPGVALVDVRTPEEYATGHAKGARNIPLDQLDAAAVESLKKKERVYVMCQSGGRSSVATAQLASQGVGAVNISGGFMAWSAARLPVE